MQLHPQFQARFALCMPGCTEEGCSKVYRGSGERIGTNRVSVTLWPQVGTVLESLAPKFLNGAWLDEEDDEGPVTYSMAEQMLLADGPVMLNNDWGQAVARVFDNNLNHAAKRDLKHLFFQYEQVSTTVLDHIFPDTELKNKRQACIQRWDEELPFATLVDRHEREIVDFDYAPTRPLSLGLTHMRTLQQPFTRNYKYITAESIWLSEHESLIGLCLGLHLRMSVWMAYRLWMPQYN